MTIQQSTQLALLALTDLVSKQAYQEGDHQTDVAGLNLHVRKAPTEPLHCIYTLSLAFVLQGSKALLSDNEVSYCHAGQTMLTTVDLPVVSHVASASRHVPFIAITLKLDYALIMQTCTELALTASPRDMKYQTLSSHPADKGLTEAFYRLVALNDEPVMQAGLRPLIEKEIVVRLLHGPHGHHLRHMASAGTPNGNIVKAISWLKQNFTQPIGMDELAGHAYMSASAFRQHFKALTGTSPLQYLKTLRLQEARDLMMVNGLDATLASNRVGYESASQFSREYSRLFGLPPQKDIQRLRQMQ